MKIIKSDKTGSYIHVSDKGELDLSFFDGPRTRQEARGLIDLLTRAVIAADNLAIQDRLNQMDLEMRVIRVRGIGLVYPTFSPKKSSLND